MIHKTHFSGSSRRLKGKTFGKWVKRNGRLVYVPRKGRK
jgi:hypothetical protein